MNRGMRGYEQPPSTYDELKQLKSRIKEAERFADESRAEDAKAYQERYGVEEPKPKQLSWYEIMSNIYHMFRTGTAPPQPKQPEILEVEVDSGLTVDVGGWDNARGLHSTLNQQRAQRGLQPLPLPPSIPPPPSIHQSAQPPPQPIPINEPVKVPVNCLGMFQL